MAHGAGPPQPGNRSGGWRRERPLTARKTAASQERLSADRKINRPADEPASGSQTGMVVAGPFTGW